jgi:hypothetical protein
MQHVAFSRREQRQFRCCCAAVGSRPPGASNFDSAMRTLSSSASA